MSDVDRAANAGSPTRRSSVGRLGSFVVLGLVVVAAIVLVARNGPALRDAAEQLGFPTLVLSGVLAVAGTACVEQVWVRLLLGAGTSFHPRAAASVFFVSQLGKYLPGALWPVVAQMEFGRRSGVKRAVMLSTNIVMLVIVAVTGLLTGAALLPWSQPEGLRRYAWAYLFLLPLLAALHPRTIPWLLNRVLRLMHRPALDLVIRPREVVLACLWGFLMWVLLGAHIVVMSAALGGGGLRGALGGTGGMALAFAAGLLVPLTPAGVGVRDAVLVLVLTPQVGVTDALAVAVASRVLMVLADVLLAVVGGIGGGRAMTVATTR